VFLAIHRFLVGKKTIFVNKESMDCKEHDAMTMLAGLLSVISTFISRGAEPAA
jgi:hypothetical protein